MGLPHSWAMAPHCRARGLRPRPPACGSVRARQRGPALRRVLVLPQTGQHLQSWVIQRPGHHCRQWGGQGAGWVAGARHSLGRPQQRRPHLHSGGALPGRGPHPAAARRSVHRGVPRAARSTWVSASGGSNPWAAAVCRGARSQAARVGSSTRRPRAAAAGRGGHALLGRARTLLHPALPLLDVAGAPHKVSQWLRRAGAP
mmetsp:Transcript_37560/g.116753  ORF Transcript_37560/g.116753 Transcript_37560/m.116753 type:complete len:201 (-) Transcript_37560:237-839(-)